MDEDADEVIVLARPTSVCDHLCHVGGVLDEGVRHRLEEDRVVGALADHHVVAPSQQVGAIGAIHAEHVADHDEWERSSDVGHQIAATGLDHLIQDGVADPTDVLLHGPDSNRREAGGNEAPTLDVLGCVHVDHHRQRSHARTDPATVREPLRVLGRVLDVSVLGQRPDVVRFVVVHGLIRPHPLERREGVTTPEGPIDQIDPRLLAAHVPLLGDPSTGLPHLEKPTPNQQHQVRSWQPGT